MVTRIKKAMEKRDQGFTLIELLVVIIIIGILAAIAIPVFLNQRQKGVDAGLKSDLRNAATALETVTTDGPWDTAGAAVAVTDIAPDFKATGDDVVEVTGSSADGYVITADNDAASAAAPFSYDSQNGGLQ